MTSRVPPCFHPALLCSLALLIAPLAADVVLLDEYWSPEIVLNDVVANEVDTMQTGDPTEARSGECSARLENRSGAPNVRFRSAACTKLSDIPPDTSEVRLWYRTDGWDATWELGVWGYDHGTTTVPVQVLVGLLDGGGGNGALIADDEWHQAKAVLAKGRDYGAVSQDRPLAVYVWLTPQGGWNVPHRTYVDRIEVLTDADHGDHPAKDPAKRVRPNPGAQTAGPGWVWFEAEDATEHNVPPGGALGPDTVEQQSVLSNGAWLQYHGPPIAATWEVVTDEDGDYSLWCRALGTPFEWRINGGPWTQCDQNAGWRDETVIRQQNIYTLSVQWVKLGQLSLRPGLQVFEVRSDVQDAQGFDCFLLTRDDYTPSGTKKPSE